MPSKQASQQGMEVLQAQLEQMVGMLSEAETKRDELQAQLTAALAAQKAAEAAAHSAKSQCAALEELMSEANEARDSAEAATSEQRGALRLRGTR